MSKKKIILPVILVSLCLGACSGSYIDEYGRVICQEMIFGIDQDLLDEWYVTYRENAEFVYHIKVSDISLDLFQIQRNNGFAEDTYLVHTPYECEVVEVLRSNPPDVYDYQTFTDWKWPEEGDHLTLFLLGSWVENQGCAYKYDLEERVSVGFEYNVYVNYWEGYAINDTKNKGNGFMTCFPSLGIDFLNGIVSPTDSEEEDETDLGEEDLDLDEDDTSDTDPEGSDDGEENDDTLGDNFDPE
ncbi:MAG: hypothetical protein LUB56_01120 [Coprobacillus sp.]|nr:hypothetical protein [Coprobacillus sp.]